MQPPVLEKYLETALFDGAAGQDSVPRTFLLSPGLQEFLKQRGPFQSQYEELLGQMVAELGNARGRPAS